MKKILNSILFSLLIVTAIGVMRVSNDVEASSTSQVILENDVFKQPAEENNIEKSYICWPWQKCYEPQYSSDSFEDNNKFNDAYNLGVFSPKRTNYKYGTIHDVSATKKDVDYYKFEIKAKKTVNIELYNIPSGTDYDLKLYTYSNGFIGIGSSSTQIASSARAGNSREKITVVLEAGEYFIKVYSYSGMSSSKYTLKTKVEHLNKYNFLNNGIAVWERNDVLSRKAWSTKFLYTSCNTTDSIIYISPNMIQYFKELEEEYSHDDYVGLMAIIAASAGNNVSYFAATGIGLAGALASGPAGWALTLGGIAYGTLVWEVNSLNQWKVDQINDIFDDAKAANTGIMIRNWTYIDSKTCNQGTEYELFSKNYVLDYYGDEEYGNVEVVTENDVKDILGY